MNKSDINRNTYMLKGPLAKKGYDWWWHSFTGFEEKTGEEKSFFIEYFIINPALAEPKPVFGQLTESILSKKRPSYCMIKAGCWGEDAKQIHRFYSVRDIVICNKPLKIDAGECVLTEKNMKGRVEVASDEAFNHPEYMCEAGSMEWNLNINKKISFNVGYGASKIMRMLQAFEMYWHAEGMKTEYDGYVIYNGKKYIISPSNCYGYADKNWGKNFTSPWLWLGCNHIINAKTGIDLHNSAFDIGGGKPKVFGIPINNIVLMNLFLEGMDLEYNFSKFWSPSKIKFKVEEEKERLVWKVIAFDRKTYIKLAVECKKKDMLLVNYEAPDGTKLHNNLYNGGNGKGWLEIYMRRKNKRRLLEKFYLKNVGCEYGVFSNIDQNQKKY